MMDEEHVTEAIEAYLRSSGWSIFAVDYPTSGSGLRIHPNDRLEGTKHAGSVVPDVVAYRKNRLLIVENKPYFDTNDAEKLARISAGTYDRSLEARVYATEFDEIVTALGFPAAYESEIQYDSVDTLDRLYLVSSDGSVERRAIDV